MTPGTDGDCSLGGAFERQIWLLCVTRVPRRLQHTFPSSVQVRETKNTFLDQWNRVVECPVNSENLQKYLKQCFQCSYNPLIFLRFCCFNTDGKLSPEVCDVWRHFWFRNHFWLASVSQNRLLLKVLIICLYLSHVTPSIYFRRVVSLWRRANWFERSLFWTSWFRRWARSMYFS